MVNCLQTYIRKLKTLLSGFIQLSLPLSNSQSGDRKSFRRKLQVEISSY